MFGREEKRQLSEVETIIGPSVRVDGKFFGKGNVVIQGQLSGSLKTQQDVRVDQGAIVKANLEAKSIVIAGEVHGNVKAREELQLSETAKVTGDVEAKTISIGAGALLNGRCLMTDQASESKPLDASLAGPAIKPGKNRRAEIPL